MSKLSLLPTLIRVRVTEDQKQQLEAIARINLLSVSDVVRMAIGKFLERNRNQDRPEPDPSPSPPPGPGPTHPPQPTPQLHPELAVG